MKKERYWLRESGSDWEEVTREQYISEERSAGFHSKSGCGDVATGAFNTELISGMITYGEITEENYGWDKDFLRVASGRS